MAATGVHFSRMSEAEMRRYAEEHPGRVNEQDRKGDTLLFAAVAHNKSLNLISWSVDEIGADVNSRNRSGETAIFEARSVDVMSFLLERGADPTVQENDGWTALMYHSNELRVDFVERLLQDPRVVAGIDVLAATNKDKNSRFRVAALHLVCRREARYTSRIARVVELLLLAGANPFLRTRPTQDGLHYLRLNNLLERPGRTTRDFIHDDFHTSHIVQAVLERAMAEPQRIYFLAKTRYMNDANHAINKAKAKALKEARTRRETESKILANTPPYLKERMEQGQMNLPRVEFRQPSNNASEGEKQMVAAMKYVLRDEGEYPEVGGMHEDVFVELLEMMAPKWDEIRGGGGGAAAAGGGGGGGGGGKAGP